MPLYELECSRGHRFEDLIGGGTCGEVTRELPECPDCAQLGLASEVRTLVSRCMIRWMPGQEPLHTQAEEDARARSSAWAAERLRTGGDEVDIDRSDPFSDNLDGDAGSSSITSLLESGNIDQIRNHQAEAVA